MDAAQMLTAREWQISLTAEALSKALRAEAADQGM